MIDILRASPRFLRYLIVGGIGFVIDAGGMEALVAAGAHVYLARALSMIAAIAATYLLHKDFTFHEGGRKKATTRQFSGHTFCQLLAGALNYFVFFCFLRLLPQPVEMPGRLFALAMGVGAGLAANYFLLRHYVFAGQEDIWQFLKNHILSSRRLWIWAVVALALALDALHHQQHILMIPNLSHQIEPWDPDIWMRLSRVRAWLQGSDFYDRSVLMTNAPIGGIETPWTRPVDFILAFLARLMPDSFTLDQKLMAAAAWMPPLLSLAMLGFLVRAATKCVNNIHVMVCAILLMLCNAIHQNYFAPGNADHHGLLIMLWCAALSFILQPLSAVAMVAAGVTMGIMLWVSPESMMLIAVVYLVLGTRALFKPDEMPYVAVMTLAAAVVSALALFFETPPSEYFSYVVYDSLSIVYVCLMSLTAAGALVVAQVFRRGAGFKTRVVTVGLAGLSVLGAMAAAYPKFLHGPLVDADPYIFKYFLPFIAEAKSLAASTEFEIAIRMYMPLLAAFFLFKSYYSPRPFTRDRQTLLLAAVMVVTLVMTSFQLRWNYYLQPAAILIVAAYLPLFAMGAKSEGFGWLRRVTRMLRPYIWLCIFVAVTACVSTYVTEKNERRAQYAYCQSQMRYLIETEQMEKVFGDRVKTVFVQTNIGGDISFFTPYSIIAGNYHREGKGLSDWRDIIKAETPKAARPLLVKRKVDALMICPTQYQEKSWLYKLADGQPSWLEKVPSKNLRFMKPEGEKLPLLFKVRK